MKHQYDAIVVGAGFAGAVTARQFAEQGKKRVLVLEKRGHIGGNAYDCLDSEGILIHRYGPHIFHTADERVYRYLSRFTTWRNYQHEVVGNLYGKLIPIPFNLNAIELVFPPDQAQRLCKLLLQTYGEGARVSILELRESTDPALSELAEYIFKNVFAYYTEKQWGTPPDGVDPSVLSRVPVLVSRDNRYFQDPYQGIPAAGYTELFRRMLDFPGIDVQLNTDATEQISLAGKNILFEGKPFDGVVIYTGALDELLGCCLGRLPYRTLDFQFETHPIRWYQPKGTVNYTVDQPFTRITEYKYFSGQEMPDCTTIVKEFARDYTGDAEEIPYYAVKNPDSTALYTRYLKMIEPLSRFYLIGRLSEYQYYNMDAIVGHALTRADELLKDWEGTD